MTVAELCDDYLTAADAGSLLTRRRKVKKASTLYVDRGRIARHIKPRLGRKLVKDVTTADIERFQKDVIEGKTAADVKTGLRGRAIVEGGPGTAARTVGLLGGIFTYAVKIGCRTDNPVRGVVRPKDRKRVVHIDTDRYRALGKAIESAEARGVPWQALDAARLLALTGCRRGEIENLRWDEVDIPGRCLRLAESKTGASLRPIGSPALELLRKRKESAKGEFVFARRGKPYKGLPAAWQRIVESDKHLASLTPHGLRHGFASSAESEGLSVPTIAALLGHAGHGVTAGYIHKVDSALLAAADKVSRSIWRAMTGEIGSVVKLPRRAQR
jgi:integrase